MVSVFHLQPPLLLFDDFAEHAEDPPQLLDTGSQKDRITPLQVRGVAYQPADLGEDKRSRSKQPNFIKTSSILVS